MRLPSSATVTSRSVVSSQPQPLSMSRGPAHLMTPSAREVTHLFLPVERPEVPVAEGLDLLAVAAGRPLVIAGPRAEEPVAHPRVIQRSSRYAAVVIVAQSALRRAPAAEQYSS